MRQRALVSAMPDKGGEKHMRKNDTGVTEITEAAGPVLNKAADDKAYFQSLQDPMKIAEALGVSPAVGYLIDLLGAEICIMQGGDIVQCVASNWK
jgi:hypothetical protein